MQRGLGNDQRVLDDLGDDLRVAGHSRQQQPRVRIGDLDLHLEVGDVLHALAERRDLTNPSLKFAIGEGLRADASDLTERHARDLVLVHQAFEVHHIVPSKREQQRPAGHGSHRRHGAALLHVHLQHPCSLRSAHRGVAQLRRQRVERGLGTGPTRLRSFVACDRVVETLLGGSSADSHLLLALHRDAAEAQLDLGLGERRAGLSHLRLD